MYVQAKQQSRSVALSALDKAAEADRALDLLRKIRAPDGFCYSPVIHALANASPSRAAEALELLEEALALRLPARDLTGCFNSALHALATVGRLADAERLLKRMRDHHVPPTELSYGAVINAAGRALEWQSALRILREMTEADPPVQPNTECYNACLKALEMGGQSERAMQMLDDMERSPRAPTSTISYNTVISALAKEGLWPKATKLLEMMETRARQHPGGRCPIAPNTVTYNSVLHALERGGQPDKAAELLELMGGRIAPDSYSYSTCIIAFAKADRPDDALRLLERMQSRRIKPDTSPYYETDYSIRNVARTLTLLPGHSDPEVAEMVMSILQER